MLKKLLSIYLISCLSLPAFSNELTLEDLKFDATDLKVDVEQQKVLEKRESLLNKHQIMGITTLALMTATMLTAPDHEHEGNTNAPLKPVSDAHKWLGIASGVSYFTTAGLSYFAPEPKNEKPASGSTKWHKRLAWIHFPAMVLTTTIGLMANSKLEKGQEPTGILKAKGTVGTIAFYSMLAAGATMTFDF